ncbi:hypothetical protein [Enterobacter sp. 22503]|uniref:hypothetical protein n=1 Tax=unclassified Enterobacter TaxID=2608935 RepID=UPI003F858E61
MVIELGYWKKEERSLQKQQREDSRSHTEATILGFPSKDESRKRDNDQATAAILNRARSLKW